MSNWGILRRAALVAGLMMAWQVAAKTARDSLFLSTFQPRALPGMIGAASVCSILLAVLSAKLLRRYGPFRLIPAGYLMSAAMHALEFLFLPLFPRTVSVIVYLHVLGLGSVLLSGFWALASEQFDPRQARRRFGRIAGFGTLGGLAGGVMAERVVTLYSNAALLPMLMVLQLACGLVLWWTSPPRVQRKPAKPPRYAEIISRAPYLVGLAGLMVLVSVTATTLDFLFKAQAVTQFGRGAALGRFFALFYMATSAVGFVAQAGASSYVLDRFGLGRTVATLPAGVAGASLLALLAPGAIALSLARGLELVLRGSLFRSGYELFYTPMPQSEKRSAKSVIDIGADRLGDGLGAAAVQLLLALPVRAATYCILLLTALLAGIGAWLAFQLDQAYRTALGKNLVETAVDLKHIEMEPFATRTAGNIAPSPSSSSTLLAAPVPEKRAVRVQHSAPPVAANRIEDLAVLQSGDARRVKEALREIGLLDPILVPQAILLLGRDDVWRAAHDALARSAFRIAGQLVDCLLDEGQDYAVRVRIPRLLSACGNRLAWAGLFEGLEDPEFELRFRCGRALDTMLQRRPEYQPDPAAVFRIIGKELSVTHSVWQGRQRSNVIEEEGHSLAVDQIVQARMSQSMAHIFSLLGLVLPREAVQTAFRALHTDDTRLRALAVEYIESAVPRELREPLSAHLEGPRAVRTKAPAQQLLTNLMEQGPTIVARLQALGFPQAEDKTHKR